MLPTTTTEEAHLIEPPPMSSSTLQASAPTGRNSARAKSSGPHKKVCTTQVATERFGGCETAELRVQAEAQRQRGLRRRLRWALSRRR